MANFQIPEHRLDELKGKIEHLNKKARKIGIDAITMRIGAYVDRKYTENPFNGQMLVHPMIIRFYDVEIIGVEPKFNGWSFLARLDHEPNGVNIINAIPGIELDPKYRTSGSVCDHCKIDRYRKSSFVVRNADGTEKQVGSTCLKDFLGHGAPEQIAALCESIFTFMKTVRDEDFLFGGTVEMRYGLIDILALTGAVIRKYGWVSGAKVQEFGGMSTADVIREYLIDDKRAAEISREIGKVTDDDVKTAENAIDWLKGKIEPLNDYFHNLKTVCANGTIEIKRIGLAVSLIAVYKREIEENLKRAAIAPSSWIGHPDVGRITLKGVKVIGNTPIDGRFGTTYVYRFLANGKDKLTWFSSNDVGLNQGDVVEVTFSVKKLDEYKGEHITVITRAKVK